MLNIKFCRLRTFFLCPTGYVIKEHLNLRRHVSVFFFDWTFYKLIVDPNGSWVWLCVRFSRNSSVNPLYMYVQTKWVDSRASNPCRDAHTSRQFMFLLLFYWCQNTYIHIHTYVACALHIRTINLFPNIHNLYLTWGQFIFSRHVAATCCLSV